MNRLPISQFENLGRSNRLVRCLLFAACVHGKFAGGDEDGEDEGTDECASKLVEN